MRIIDALVGILTALGLILVVLAHGFLLTRAWEAFVVDLLGIPGPPMWAWVIVAGVGDGLAVWWILDAPEEDLS